MNHLKFTAVLLGFLTIICPHASAEEFIIESKLFDYKAMVSFLKMKGENVEKNFQYCCQYQDRGAGARPNTFIKFEKEAAWFVYLKINNYSVVERDMQGQCKSFWGNEKECEKQEIDEEYNKRIATFTAIPGWYGKYHNRFSAWSNSKQIPDTAKFIGHDIDYFDRSGARDEIVVGPLPQRPTKLELNFYHGAKELLYQE